MLLTNSNTTSSDALRPNFPKILLVGRKALLNQSINLEKNPALLLENEHLNTSCISF